MKKLKIILASVLFLSTTAFSQYTNGKKFAHLNTISIELCGFTPHGTINYERVIIDGARFKTAVMIGYGFEGIPIVINEVRSFGNSHIIAGLGVLLPEHLTKSSLDITRPFLTGQLGYRYQKPEGKFVFQVGIMPVATQDAYGINAFSGKPWYIWPGLSFGYAF
jgi:hypothetical protein